MGRRAVQQSAADTDVSNARDGLVVQCGVTALLDLTEKKSTTKFVVFGQGLQNGCYVWNCTVAQCVKPTGPRLFNEGGGVFGLVSPPRRGRGHQIFERVFKIAISAIFLPNSKFSVTRRHKKYPK